jgi:lipoprotein-anchoring transpeptidase ErfK/SrfK
LRINTSTSVLALLAAGLAVPVLAQTAVPPENLESIVEETAGEAAVEPAAAPLAPPEEAPQSALPGIELVDDPATSATDDETVAEDEPAPTVEDLDVAAVNAATFSPHAESIRGASPLILKAQVLLDRAGASPGVIDSYYGGNVAKAIAAVETVLGLPIDGLLDPQVWAALGGDQAAPVLVEYVIAEDDLAGPFVDSIPADYSEQAALDSLAYAGPVEMFSERFHMDADLLLALNPEADFAALGQSIIVADVQGQAIAGLISRIDVDKTLKQLRAYDAENRLVVAYPATIGSEENPSPSGNHTVEEVVPDPWYHYDPDNFVQGDNMQELDLPPGPNNPVGNIWIALSEPGYGIHGTPEPSRIDKTGSHGCIRLTNWDAAELAAMVQPGVTVSFIE